MNLNFHSTCSLLAKALSTEACAALLNELMSAESDPRYLDVEVEIGQAIFDRLSELRPDAVDAAQGRPATFCRQCQGKFSECGGHYGNHICNHCAKGAVPNV